MNGVESNFNGRLRTKTAEPTSWADLVNLPNSKMAFIYQRLSTHEQMKKSIYSIKAQDALYELAKEDGYTDEQIYTENRDLGISGTKGREDRPGLAYLIELVEANKVEAVYVVHISRLYRDQTLINALALGELFKEHNVIIVTPQMRLNLRDKLHMRLYRMEIERAADELELMNSRLYGAKRLKARSGYYAGEFLPAGYVVDERKELENGESNPKYHTYQIYEPHAEVIRQIFNLLLKDEMTPTRVARYLKKEGVVFRPFPLELNTKANLKTFLKSRRNSDGSWMITVSQVRSIATNPQYLGWRLWEGEVVSKNAYPPIINEHIFWAIQARFNTTGKNLRPKKEYDPLPLAGLLYCGNHNTPQQMGYANDKEAYHNYSCFDNALKNFCTSIRAYFLDVPISEVIISQIALPGLAEQVLSKLANEYEQAKERAASYRREMKRLESEVNNLRSNLSRDVLSLDQLRWLDEQIQTRLARINELADLEKQPIGVVIGKPEPGQADIQMVEAFLKNLPTIWPQQPNDLKNAFLRLLLDKIVIYNDNATIRAKITWRVGLEQEILIHKPFDKGRRSKWSDSETQILCQFYETASKEELMSMLPGRSWMSIREKAHVMKLPKKVVRRAARFTPKEDEIIKRYCAGEISKEEAITLTGRDTDNIRGRIYNLGLVAVKNELNWEWVDKGSLSEKEASSKRSAPARRS